MNYLLGGGIVTEQGKAAREKRDNDIDVIADAAVVLLQNEGPMLMSDIAAAFKLSETTFELREAIWRNIDRKVFSINAKHEIGMSA